MSEELLINVSPVESRIAVLNNGVVSEIYIERHNKLGLVGNIYLGTVVRVLPGMQAAFIDIGQSRTAFLHVNDMQRLPKPAPTLSELPDISHTEPKKPTLLTSLTVDHPDKVPEQTATDASNKTANGTVNSTMVTEAQNSSGEQVPVSNFNDGNEKANSGATIDALPLTEDDSIESTVKPSPLSASISQVVAEASLTNNSQALNSYITNFATNSVNPLSTDDIKQSASLAASTDIQNELQRVDVSNIGLSHPINVNNINSDKGLGEKKSALTDESSNLDEALTDSLNVGSSNTTQLPSAVGNQTVEQQQVENHSGSKQVPKHELIQNRLHQGQKILVQVTKDQLGTKGARLTTNISLPSRFLVYIPSSEHIGISQRIDNEEERTRLKSELSTLMSTFNLQGGVIARTAAERVAVSKLEEDIYYLVQLWRSIQARKNEAALTSHPATLIYQELSLPLRAIRDLVHPETEKVIVDNQKIYEQVKQFAREFVPSIEPRIIPYTSDQPLFDVHRVEDDLRDALKRRVDLKSGGYLVIDQTEAMTTIDVNTGSYVGARSLEDTVYKTNLEATHAIAHQLRLRNLGGIIILDFIDMSEQEHKDDVLNSLQARLAQDYAKTKITQVSELGLVEMTRKRTRESLEQQLCEPCQTCQGKGFIKTAETVCFEIFREIMRCARTYDSPKKFTVVAHAAVIDLLLSSEADTVADLEYLVGRVITFEVEDLYTQEQYDIVLD